jgi:hypothetical protein
MKRTRITHFDTRKADVQTQKCSEETETKNRFLVHKRSTNKMGEEDLR